MLTVEYSVRLIPWPCKVSPSPDRTSVLKLGVRNEPRETLFILEMICRVWPINKTTLRIYICLYIHTQLEVKTLSTVPSFPSLSITSASRRSSLSASSPIPINAYLFVNY